MGSSPRGHGFHVPSKTPVSSIRAVARVLLMFLTPTRLIHRRTLACACYSNAHSLEFVMILYCSDPLARRHPDAAYAAEVETADKLSLDHGLIDFVALVDARDPQYAV